MTLLQRGLPHAHLLLWLKTKIHLADMDKLISAEIPPKSDPVLLSVVKKQMVHSHTEACKDGSKCKKKFPKAFTPFTIMNSDGYPSYKRRSPQNGGNTFEVKRGEEIITIDNSWIVPYCPFLSRAFQCHINVEYCSSIKSIKYVCKYVLKVRIFVYICSLRAKRFRKHHLWLTFPYRHHYVTSPNCKKLTSINKRQVVILHWLPGPF